MHLRPPVDSGTLSALLECFPCPALIVGKDRRVRAANQAFRARAPAVPEVVGAACYEILHGRRRPCPRRRQVCPLDACVRTGTVVPAIHRHSPGLGAQVVVSPIQAQDGTVVACVATLPAAAPDSQDRPDPSSTRHSGIAIAPVEGRLASLGRSRQAVLIEGEPGSGRSHVARAIHRQRRSPGPYEERSGAELTEDAAQALWVRARGHERGGTLHLRDVHGLRLRTQGVLAKLVSAGTGGRRRWRLVSSTDRNLHSLVSAGLFHRELFSRLSVRRLRLPPLRERQDELPEIVRALLEGLGSHVSALTDAALERLRAYPFPGNLDELEQALRHASLMTQRGTADVDHLPDWLSPPEPPGPHPSARVVTPRGDPTGRGGRAPQGRTRRGSSDR